MAKIKNTVGIDVKTTGTQKAAKNIDQVTKAQTRQTSSGVSASRQFSAQASGLGGLVAAYAGAAANVFALQQAFDALRRAAQAETIVKGTQALALAVGQSGQRILTSIQEITQGQLTLAEAAQQANIALSAGFSTDQIELLTVISAKASRALGRTLSDAFTRVTRGAAKLEPELLDELGIFVRIDPAVQKYANRLGVAANSLTNFERRQAFVNAIIDEGEAKFEAIDIASESSQKSIERFITTITDLATKFGQVIAGPVSSVLDFFEKDIGNALVVFGGILALVFGKATQLIGGFAANAIKDLSAFADVLATTANRSKSSMAAMSAGVIDLNSAISQRGGLAKDGGAFAQKGVARAEASAGAQIRKRFRAGGVSPRQMQDDLEALKRIKPQLDKNSAAFKDSAIIIDTYDKALKGTTRTSRLLTKTSIGLTKALRGVGIAARFAFKFLNVFIAIIAGAQFLASFFGFGDIVGSIADAFKDMSTRADDIADGLKGAVSAALPAAKELEETLKRMGVKEEDIKNFGDSLIDVFEEVNKKAEEAAQKNIARQVQAGKQAILAAPEADRPGIARQLREQILVTKEKARQTQIDLEIDKINDRLASQATRRNKLSQDEVTALRLRKQQLIGIRDIGEQDLVNAELVGRIARLTGMTLAETAKTLKEMDQSGDKGKFSFLGVEIETMGIMSKTAAASLAGLNEEEIKAIENGAIFTRTLKDTEERFARGAIDTDKYQEAVKGLQDRFDELKKRAGASNATIQQFSAELEKAKSRVKELKATDAITKSLIDNFKSLAENVDKAFGKGLADSTGKIATTQREITKNTRDLFTNTKLTAGEFIILNGLQKDGEKLTTQQNKDLQLTQAQLKRQEGELIKIINSSGQVLRNFQKQELSLKEQLKILQAQARLADARQDSAAIALEAKILNREMSEEVKLQQKSLELFNAQNNARKQAFKLEKDRLKILADIDKTQRDIDESKRKEAASGVIAGLERGVAQSEAELANLQRFENLSTQDARVAKQEEIIKREFELQMAVINEKERVARQEAENQRAENTNKINMLNKERDQNAKEMALINDVAAKEAAILAATQAIETTKIQQEQDRLVAQKGIIEEEKNVALAQLEAEKAKRDFDEALLDLRIAADKTFAATVEAFIRAINSTNSPFVKAAEAISKTVNQGVGVQGIAATTDVADARARVKTARGDVDAARESAINVGAANRTQLADRELESIEKILEQTRKRQQLDREIAEIKTAAALDEKIAADQNFELKLEQLHKERELIQQNLSETLTGLENERAEKRQNSATEMNALKDANDAVKQFGNEVGGNLKNSFRDFYSSIAEGNSVLDSAKGAFQSFMLSLLDSVQEKLTQKFIDPVIDSLMGAIFAAGGPVHLAGGGAMKRDRIPAMLEPGEFVIRKPMARAIGGPALSAMNGHGKGLGMPQIDVQINNSGAPKDAEAQVKPQMDVNKMVVEIVTRDLKNNGPIRKTLRGDQ